MNQITVEEVKEILLSFKDDRKFDITRWISLDTIDNKQYALVFGWVDGYNPVAEDTPLARKDYRVCGKLAYCPLNSIMHEYSMDWIMPTYNDEVYDTESSISLDDYDIKVSVEWWLKEWNTMLPLIKEKKITY